ncbi:MAG: redox-sensing transcriptional repressor Rex [Candidatus Muirbacterium halophilum]|nr:redox-sensing transcriptional repressor Rex [Candidatus Muirbacterium halophilum]MCK9474874.1 redox-sensing transcriptional repressor Rex [Candidatus Muirbacterium halophilum]
MDKIHISNKTIERLSRYLRYLTYLELDGVERVDSKELAELALVSPALLRKDLSHFGGFGKSGYGYDIVHLKKSIEKILNTDNPKNFIIIGAGNIGKALANYIYFEKLNFMLKAIFDCDSKKISEKIGKLNVKSCDDLSNYLKEYSVDIAILTTPMQAVKGLFHILVQNEVPAVWNFAPIDIKSAKNTHVINEHLSKNLLVLSYHIKNKH